MRHMKKTVIVAIIAAAVAIPVLAYAAGPLFINTTLNEPAPVAAGTDMMESKDGNIPRDPEIMTSDALAGSFIGVGDGIHDATGDAKVIPVAEGNVLRLENFRSTNGPDLYVYLSSDKGATEFVSLGRLKANSGNQNYDIPNGTDLSKYDNVLIWCQQFSVLFGSAQLMSS
jgi:hypothetical protein